MRTLHSAIEMMFLGRMFRVERYDCVWTVLQYHRNGAWVCCESVNQTTCNFYTDEIIEGLIP